ncbi:MAG: M60 family metallopeptidase, partial [Dysgonamonadaceae bacterium]|nr:M60 family metallopeptidase [Dysgonamonadaceae bacterium]
MKKILFVLMAAALFASCSEGETPEVKPGPQQPGTSTFNPTTLFTDLSCTQLQAGITKEQIETTCQVEPYRTMALQMLAGTYPGEFRIMEVEALPHPSVDATLNKTAKYGVMDNPTGISVSSRDTLRVFASGLYAAGAATFKIQTLTTSGTGGYGLGPDEIALSNGENVIVVPPLSTGKGLGYIRYYYADGTKPGNLKVNIFGGEVNGYFDPVRKHHTDADWQRLIAAAVNPYFDITGKYAAVTAPTDWYRRYTDGRGTDLVNTYDAVVYLEWKFMGLLDSPDGFDGRHRTRAYFHQEKMGEGVGAYASDYHTAYPGEYMVKPDAIAGGDIWVFGHEHGHVNQTRPAFRWAGMVEVTNNLEAMYLRTHIKQLLPFSTNTAVNTNLQTITDGGYVNTYERAFNWFIGKDRPLATPTPHNRNDNNAHLFHQLVPFWQLYLYLDNVLGKTGTHKASFYEDIYEHYRKNDASVSTRTDGQHQLYFVELVCKTANLDLSDFFLKTGFLQPYSAGNFLVSQAMVDATIDKIKSYPLPPQPFEYITDGNIDIFRERLSLQTGSGAEVNKNGKFTTPPAGWTNAVAFEVRENNADGDIKCIFTADNGITSQAFGGNGFIFNSSSGHHLYAVAHDGERREVPVSVAGSTPTPPEFTIAAGSKVQYLNPVLKTSDTWNLELSTTWIAENHIGQWGSPLLASDEDPGKDGKDQKFQYWWNAPDNK